MASRKQKHAMVMAKRESRLAAERRVGQEALERDHAERARQARFAEAEKMRRRNSITSKMINLIAKSLDANEETK